MIDITPRIIAVTLIFIFLSKLSLSSTEQSKSTREKDTVSKNIDGFFHVNQMLSNIFITEDSNTSQEPSCQLRLGRETWEMDGFPQPPGS